VFLRVEEESTWNIRGRGLESVIKHEDEHRICLKVEGTLNSEEYACESLLAPHIL
jgi:hypothetical protein